MMAFWAKKFGFAVSGIWHVAKTQASMRVHMAVAVVVIGLATFLQLSRIEFTILFVTIGVVMAAEVINTAIEAVVDLISPEKTELARIAKDTSAGAVLVLAVTAVFVGLLILGPPLVNEFGIARVGAE